MSEKPARMGLFLLFLLVHPILVLCVTQNSGVDSSLSKSHSLYGDLLNIWRTENTMSSTHTLSSSPPQGYRSAQSAEVRPPVRVLKVEIPETPISKNCVEGVAGLEVVEDEWKKWSFSKRGSCDDTMLNVQIDASDGEEVLLALNFASSSSLTPELFVARVVVKKGNGHSFVGFLPTTNRGQGQGLVLPSCFFRLGGHILLTRHYEDSKEAMGDTCPTYGRYFGIPKKVSWRRKWIPWAVIQVAAAAEGGKNHEDCMARATRSFWDTGAASFYSRWSSYVNTIVYGAKIVDERFLQTLGESTASTLSELDGLVGEVGGMLERAKSKMLVVIVGDSTGRELFYSVSRAFGLKFEREDRQGAAVSHRAQEGSTLGGRMQGRIALHYVWAGPWEERVEAFDRLDVQALLARADAVLFAFGSHDLCVSTLELAKIAARVDLIRLTQAMSASSVTRPKALIIRPSPACADSYPATTSARLKASGGCPVTVPRFVELGEALPQMVDEAVNTVSPASSVFHIVQLPSMELTEAKPDFVTDTLHVCKQKGEAEIEKKEERMFTICIYTVSTILGVVKGLLQG
uniref:Uncharacterized protein n=1 Tax=Palpitomonas bilix TaxID=652834 RepID=A0A7S3GKL9_9EUKA|mmetsp:Transcript_7459/g.19259  ORF Transcript_7459/g.19259 Transcript_7459/m.19259 type:complete len:574 (+) Transcript_7459:270-1991(+)